MQEEKRGRGRPATGRKRDIKFSVFLTEEERELIKQNARKKKITVADYLTNLVKKDIEKN